jgi:biopolymer transport protein ExbB/TolQ
MLYPAMFILVAGFSVVVVSSGAALAEWAERSRAASRVNGGGTYQNAALSRRAAVMEELDEILRQPGAAWEDVDALWRRVRLRSWRRLDHLRILARLAPAMGLVGTLIPMSTGLASLSQGDASRLSGDLVVAFSTTVVGLCSGVGAYILYTVKAGWLECDLGALESEMESRASRALDSPEGVAK